MNGWAINAAKPIICSIYLNQLIHAFQQKALTGIWSNQHRRTALPLQSKFQNSCIWIGVARMGRYILSANFRARWSIRKPLLIERHLLYMSQIKLKMEYSYHIRFVQSSHSRLDVVQNLCQWKTIYTSPSILFAYMRNPQARHYSVPIFMANHHTMFFPPQIQIRSSVFQM